MAFAAQLNNVCAYAHACNVCIHLYILPYEKIEVCQGQLCVENSPPLRKRSRREVVVKERCGGDETF